MLQVKVNSDFIELFPDFAFTMNLKSPLFSDVGSASYPFKFPASPHNNKLLGFFNRVEAVSNPYQEYPAEIYFNGILVFVGLLKCVKGNSDAFEGQFYEGRGDFFYQAKTKSLQNFHFGKLDFNDDPCGLEYARDCEWYEYPDRNICFPEIKNDAYFDPLPTNQLLWYFNYYFKQDGNHPEASMELRDEFGDGSYMVLVPCLYFKYVIETIFAQMGYTINRNFFNSHPDFNRLAIYNSVNANEDPAIPVFETSMSRIYLDYHVPRIGLSAFIKGYESLFGCYHFINPLTKCIDIISVKEILDDKSSVDYSNNVISMSTDLEDKIKGFGLKMNLDSGDPEYAYMISEQDMFFSYLKEPVQRVLDLPAWPAGKKGDIRWVEDEQCYYCLLTGSSPPYTWGPTYQNGDAFVWYTETVLKEKQQIIETPFSTLDNYFGNALCSVKNTMLEWEDISPRVFFSVRTYGENGQVNPMAHNITNSINLFYNGPTGIYKKYWFDFLSFRINSKNIKITRSFTFDELRHFDFSRKYLIDGKLYLFKDLQVTFKINQILPAVINAVTEL